MIKYVYTYYNKIKKYILILLPISLIASCISLVSTYMIGLFVDVLNTKPTIDFIIQFSIIFFLLNIVQLIISYFTNLLTALANLKMANFIIHDTITHLQRISVLISSKSESVYLSGRIHSDANTIATFFINTIQSVIIKLIITFILFIYISVTNIGFFLVLLLLVIIYFIIFYFFRKPLYERGYNFKEVSAEYLNSINEQIFFSKYTQINSNQENFINKLKNAFGNIFDKGKSMQSLFSVFSVVDSSIIVCVNLALFFLAGISIINKTMTIGQFTILMQYSNVVITCIRYFFSLGQAYQNFKISYDRLQDLNNIPEKQTGLIEFDKITSITLSELFFEFENNKTLQCVNLTFKMGTMYLIYGKNGTGKTTLIYNIIGLYEKTSGEIYYNGIEMSQCNMEVARKNNFALMEQSIAFPKGNIIEYLSFSNCRKYTEKEIFSLLKKQKFNFLIPEILEIIERDIARAVSGGEKQKIEICRLILKNSEVMIFDEPTAHLDQQSRKAFYECLRELKHNKIIIITSHNIEEQDYFDEIINIMDLHKDNRNLVLDSVS